MVGRVVAVWEDREVVVDVCEHKRDLRSKTVAELKWEIEKAIKPLIKGFTYVTVEKLYFGDEELDEDSTLSEYGIKHMARVKALVNIGPIFGSASGSSSRSMEELADFKSPCSIM